MKYIQFLLLTLLFSLSFGQENKGATSHYLIHAGYANLNGNYFKIGPEIYLVQENFNIVDLSATANLAYFKDHFVVVPEVGIGYKFSAGKLDPYKEYINASFYTLRVSASPWHVTPEIGFTLLGLLEANVGYGFEFREHDYTTFDGLKLGITFHIPTQLFSKN